MSISESESDPNIHTTVIIPGIDPTNESTNTTSTIEVDNHNDTTNHNDSTDADDENSESETEIETVLPITSNRTFNDDYDYNDYDRHFYDNFVTPQVTQTELTYEPEDFHTECLAFKSWNR